MQFFNSLSSRIGHALALYGGGLFFLSFLDSSFIPFPGINDIALIVLASKHPARSPFYALLSTLGSLLGCFVMYGIARGGGRLAGGKRSSTKRNRARRWLEQNEFVSMLVMALLPPPAPLKFFVIAAGALRMNMVNFGAALLVGRSLRFAAIAWLGAHYGAEAEAYLKKNLTWASVVTIVLVIALALIFRWWKARQPATDDSV
ncbi:MAG: VTT domain-containing protein [Terriglobia bacterium]